MKLPFSLKSSGEPERLILENLVSERVAKSAEGYFSSVDAAWSAKFSMWVKHNPFIFTALTCDGEFAGGFVVLPLTEEGAQFVEEPGFNELMFDAPRHISTPEMMIRSGHAYISRVFAREKSDLHPQLLYGLSAYIRFYLALPIRMTSRDDEVLSKFGASTQRNELFSIDVDLQLLTNLQASIVKEAKLPSVRFMVAKDSSTWGNRGKEVVIDRREHWAPAER